MKPLTLHELREETVERLLKSRTATGLTNDQIKKELQALERKVFSRKRHQNPLRGQHNLRFDLMTKLNGLGSEKGFEKRLAKEAWADRKSGQTGKWANQIPIWSGVCGSGDRQTNIDVGYSPEVGKFSLYELKIGSDHPLYAVVELITYALGYLIVRKLANERCDEDRDKKRIGAHDGGLLNAKAISFSVLAPVGYYKKPTRGEIALCKCELKTLIDCTNDFLNCVSKDQAGSDCLQIDFSLQAMQIEIPGRLRNEKDLDNWINQSKGRGTLRNLILRAESIVADGRAGHVNKCCPGLSH